MIRVLRRLWLWFQGPQDHMLFLQFFYKLWFCFISSALEAHAGSFINLSWFMIHKCLSYNTGIHVYKLTCITVEFLQGWNSFIRNRYIKTAVVFPDSFVGFVMMVFFTLGQASLNFYKIINSIHRLLIVYKPDFCRKISIKYPSSPVIQGLADLLFCRIFGKYKIIRQIA